MFDILYLFIFIFPAYIANSAPVILGGKFPIDFNKKFFDGRPILGKGKTYLGLLGGFLAGMLSSILEAKILIGSEFDIFASNFYLYLEIGFLLSSGALLGDLLGSFIKRRLGIKQGKSSFLLDQLTFLVVALFFVYIAGFRYLFSLENILFLFFFTYILHRAANYIAFMLKLKKVPW
ncbi:MAG: CDP-2,3-bis-(O-geranylgeranyl)-sn-glycerol synthase [Candidatus Anstonellaceae archaeon]